MLKIGDFSKLSCISIRMLHYYDKNDIFKPSYVDDVNGYRFYEISQLEDANMILRLNSLGFSTKVIKKILDDRNEENINNYFNIRVKEIEDELERVLKVKYQINQLIKNDYKNISYNVVKKEIPTRIVASCRKVINNYMCEGELWDILFKELYRLGINTRNDGYVIAIFHDLEYKEENVEVEVQVTVDKIYENTDVINFYETDMVEVAAVTFNGSYDKMSEVTRSALNWIELNNYVLKQPTFNIYHVTPAQDINCDNWVTESCFIIKERM